MVILRIPRVNADGDANADDVTVTVMLLLNGALQPEIPEIPEFYF